MSRDNAGRVELTRRTFLGATGAGLVGTGLAGPADAASSGPGDGGDGGGGDGGGGFDGSGGARRDVTVTLVTGETVHVTERDVSDERAGDRSADLEADEAGIERTYAVEPGDFDAFEVREEPEGTYLVPDGADLDRMDRLFFNVDYLVENGFTDEETDTIPVIERYEEIPPFRTFDEGERRLESISGIAREVPKERGDAAGRAMGQGADHLHLDRAVFAELDESAPTINAGEARDEFGVDGDGVRIAIIDTGIDANHPDFGDRVVYEANYSDDEDARDLNGHGTHVAGIAAGDGSEDGDYVGIAPGADLMNVKALNEGGAGSLSDIVEAIEDAVENGADVVNMSLGAPAYVADDPLVEATNAAASEGVTPVTSAGNIIPFGDNYESITSPGIAEGAITVGTDEEVPWQFRSAVGPTTGDYLVKPEVIAPGVGVTAPGSQDADEYPYTDKTGTSMSAPHVAGTAALLLEGNSGWDPQTVENALAATAEDPTGEDVYHRGGGRVDVSAALSATLLVHDAVTSFGVTAEETTLTETIELENVGEDPIDVDLEATLVNVQRDESLDENVTLTPETVSAEPGETRSVDVTVDTADATGFNSGEITLTAGERTFTAVFGFTRGLPITVEVEPIGDVGSSGSVRAHSHDGSVSETVGTGPDDRASFLSFDPDHLDGVDFTVWSQNSHPTEEGTVWTITETHVDADDTHIALDETETVPRTLDLDPIREDGPYEVVIGSDSIHANLPEADSTAITIMYGNFDPEERRTWYTPIEEEWVVGVANRYTMAPTAHGPGGLYDVPVLYNLLYPSQSIDPPEDVIRVDPDRLARDDFEYYRTPQREHIVKTPTTFPRPLEEFPGSVWIGQAEGIGEERVEQTIYRTENTRYEEDWHEESLSARGWQAQRLEKGRLAERGDEHRIDFNRDPLTGYLTEWDLSDGALSFSFAWYADQGNPKMNVRFYDRFDLDPDNLNELLLTVDDETLIDFASRSAGDAIDWPEIDVDPGSTVTLSGRGNHMQEIHRGTRTFSDYEVAYDPDGTNHPPQVERVELAGLDTLNRLPSGQAVGFVDVAESAAEIERFEAYYSTGTVNEPPFDDADGWHEAETIYEAGSTRGVSLDLTGGGDRLHLAVGATTESGNAAEMTTINSAYVVDWAEETVPIDVKPETLNIGSNRTVPVEIPQTNGLDPRDDIDVDTLRFGDPDAVHGDGGATPRRHQNLGNGNLLVHFPVRDTGYEEDRSPAAVALAGSLMDGTPVSGADVVDRVKKP